MLLGVLFYLGTYADHEHSLCFNVLTIELYSLRSIKNQHTHPMSRFVVLECLISSGSRFGFLDGGISSRFDLRDGGIKFQTVAP